MKICTVRKHARKYGDEEVDEAQRKVLNMTEEEYERFENLGKEIRERLKEAVLADVSPGQ